MVSHVWGILGMNQVHVGLRTAKKDVQLTVRNLKTNNILPDADVVVLIKNSLGKTESTSGKSDLNGILQLKGLPMCGDVTITVTKLEYAYTTLSLKMDNWQGRDTTVRLRSLGESITFYVKSTTQPYPGLPGATVKAEIKCRSGAANTIETVPRMVAGRVNTEGSFDLSLCPSAEVVLTVQMTGYYDTTWVGKMPDVRTFTKEQRTIKLQAKTKPLNILVVDAKTNAPIANAEVSIRCNGSDLPPERFTDNTGIAQVPVDPNCELNIKAKKDGDYEPGEKTVKMSDVVGSKVVIPLNPIPKEKDLDITVKDGATGLSLPDATVEVRGAGTFKTDVNGRVTVPKLIDGTSQSITAAYPDYDTRTVQHDCCDKLVIELFPKLRHCGDGLVQGKMEEKIEIWDLNSKVTSCTIVYDMENIPDNLEVYEGFDRQARGTVLLQTGPVSGRKTISITFANPTRYVTVKIIGVEKNTSWRYQVNCD